MCGFSALSVTQTRGDLKTVIEYKNLLYSIIMYADIERTNHYDVVYVCKLCIS